MRDSGGTLRFWSRQASYLDGRSLAACHKYADRGNMITRLIAILLLTSVVGCSTQRAWVYRSNDYAANAGRPQKSVVVLPFHDSRDNANENRIAFYLIPLFPYGYADFKVPEGEQAHITSGLWTNYKPTEDFPKALAQELTATGRYKEASFSFRSDNADYVLKGDIVNTDYDGITLSYGLSVYGPLFWLIGLPAGTVDNDLTVKLSCTDGHTGAVLFERQYSADHFHDLFWVYDMPNDFNYPDMLRSVYGRFVSDLTSSGKCA